MDTAATHSEQIVPGYLDNSLPKLPFMAFSGVVYKKCVWPFLKEKLKMGFTWKPYQLTTAGWELSRFSKLFFSDYAKKLVGEDSSSAKKDRGLVKEKQTKTTENIEAFRKYMKENASFEYEKLWLTQKSLGEKEDSTYHRPRYTLAFARRTAVENSAGQMAPSKEMVKYTTSRPYRLSSVKKHLGDPELPVSFKDMFTKVGEQDIRAWRVASYRSAFMEEQGIMACAVQDLKEKVGMWIGCD